MSTAKIVFPQPRAVVRFATPRTADGASQTQPNYYVWRSPAEWVASTLRSPQAIDALCQKVRAASEDGNPAAVRAAVLLLEQNRLQITPGSSRDLVLTVRAESPEIAQLLCQGLLEYLQEQTNELAALQVSEAEKAIPAPDAGMWAQFVRQERELVEELRRRTTQTLGLGPAPSASPRASGDAEEAANSLLALRRGAYAEAVRELRGTQTAKLNARLRAASLSPSFSVLDPPTSQPLSTYPAHWCLLGALAGGVAGYALAGPRQDARNRSSRRIKP